MNVAQRQGTTKAKVSLEEFSSLKSSFWQENMDVVSMEKILMDLNLIGIRQA